MYRYHFLTIMLIACMAALWPIIEKADTNYVAGYL